MSSSSSDKDYRAKQSAITKENWISGKYILLIKPLSTRHCLYEKCKHPFKVKPYNPKKFCNNQCAAYHNNYLRSLARKVYHCKLCNKSIRKCNQYCSIQCQMRSNYLDYIEQWKQGKIDGSSGKAVLTLSVHIRRYLLEKFGEQCSICGWDTPHPLTKKVPLEVDHIDGNADNNHEDNLRLLCPNCHALTLNFKGHNRGNGRKSRRIYRKTHMIDF